MNVTSCLKWNTSLLCALQDNAKLCDEKEALEMKVDALQNILASTSLGFHGTGIFTTD